MMIDLLVDVILRTGDPSPDTYEYERVYRTTQVCSSFLNTQLSIARNAFDLGKIPFFIAQRTHRPGLQPALNAIQMKHMAAVPKGNR